jgi:ketol-acid reductoisomerase
MTTLIKDYEVCLSKLARLEKQLETLHTWGVEDEQAKTELINGLKLNISTLEKGLAKMESEMLDEAQHDQLTRDHF